MAWLTGSEVAAPLVPPGSWRTPEVHLPFLLDADWYRGVVALQSTVSCATVEFWSVRDVANAYLPITTGAISSPMGLGSDSKPVSVIMHGQETYLADSMQFGLELACRLSPNGAYYIMPSFRGESADSTHLSQFMHSEAELPCTLDVMMDVVEEYVRHLAQAVLNRNSKLLVALEHGYKHIESLAEAASPFSRMTFDEAAAALRDVPGAVLTSADGTWRTLSRAGESHLMERHGPFLWVSHWDPRAVPFYQATTDGRALNADLLFGMGETVGAGQRHASEAELLQAMSAHAIDPAPYAWYSEMKSRTPMITSGFGMGIERFLMWVTGATDIRDFQIMLRDTGKNYNP